MTPEPSGGGGSGSASVTVVIPVWGAAYLGSLPAALASASGPGRTAIVVVGAGEPDPPVTGDVEVIRAEEPLSVGAARNLGLAAVRTPYVVFLDADDQLIPEAQETMLAALEADPGSVAAVSQAIDRESGEVVAPRRGVARLARYPSLLAFADAVWSLLPTQGSAVIRTDAARAAGGYADVDGGEDWAFGVALARRGRIAVIPDPGLVYDPAGFRDGLVPRGEMSARAALARRSWRRSGGVGATVLLPVVAVLQLGIIHVLRPLLAGRSAE